MADANQNTTGNDSPAIAGDNNRVNSPDFNFFRKANPAIEVRSIMQLIMLLTIQADKAAKEGKLESIDTEKDIDKKINERFSAYKDKIKEEWIQLHPLFGEYYTDALNETGLTEQRSEMIAALLRRMSNEYLDKSSNNPTEALNLLTDELATELANAEKAIYSQGAIRYYLLKQLIACNIFPDPTI